MFTHPQLRTVICNSKMVRDDIARRFALSDDKLTVIYNGVDTAHFSPMSARCRSALRSVSRRCASAGVCRIWF
jgi:glycosyltransferase involved in cell wall biosynthesis